MNEAIKLDCTCYSTAKDGVIYPVLCRQHDSERSAAIGLSVYKYQRYFETEQDAKDRLEIIYGRWPPEGYGTIAGIHKVSRWWLVFGWWSDSCE